MKAPRYLPKTAPKAHVRRLRRRVPKPEVTREPGRTQRHIAPQVVALLGARPDLGYQPGRIGTVGAALDEAIRWNV